MKRLKLAFKAALIPAIVGLIIFIVGVILLISGFATAVDGLIIAGIFVTVVGIFSMFMAFKEGQKTLRAICPECEKYMGNTGGVINYGYECTQYKENYDSSTHNLKDYTFYYTCTIECPHCGNTSTFEYKINAKSASKADIEVDKYLKNILKIKG